jgi:hypothetical protein
MFLESYKECSIARWRKTRLPQTKFPIAIGNAKFVAMLRESAPRHCEFNN